VVSVLDYSKVMGLLVSMTATAWLRERGIENPAVGEHLHNMRARLRAARMLLRET
jgi:hypothetical protein